MADHFRRLALAVATRDWMDEGACRGEDPEWWFSSNGEDAQKAKAVCAECPVQVECLEYAIAIGEEHGVWGGAGERERRRIRRRRRELQVSA